MRNLTWIPASLAAVALVGCHTGFQHRESGSRLASPVPQGVARTAPSAPRVERVASRPVPAAPAAVAVAPVRPVNATCPVMVGTPVDGTVTTVWQGRVVAFADAGARRAWEASPSTYAPNLPRASGSSGDASPFLLPSTARLVTPPTVAPAPIAPAPTIVPVAAAPAPLVAPPPTTRALASPALSSARVVPPATPAMPAAPAPAALRAAPPATSPLSPSIDAAGSPADGSGGEECEDCPGGHCRLPGR